MIESFTLSSLSPELNGVLIGSDVEFKNVSTDTRSLSEGDLYLALKGENFNGHEFVAEAKKNGAAAAIVSAAISIDLPVLQVKDTHTALANIALLNRQRSSAVVSALTGSQGKTTVKEMARSILSLTGKTLATSKNLNNTIGVPLTLLKLADHEFAVIEMGANCAGEIAFSARATQPDIVLITKASPAHIEGFGSLQGIVEAKGEIIDHLNPLGVALFNADDANVAQWIERAGSKRTALFSLEEKKGSSFYASKISISDVGESTFELHTPLGCTDVKLRLLGLHNVVNAVAAAAIAVESGATLDQVSKGLSSLSPIEGRMYFRKGIYGCSVLDDTYNASPDSFFSAIQTIMHMTGRKVVVAGDMKELGDSSKESHEQVGKFAAQAGVDQLWATGEMSKFTASAFGNGALYFEDKNDLIEHCKSAANKELVLLVKGSRGAKMNDVVNKLIEQEDI